jgi:predicted ATP-grasp superfamily ATP-dependent carboligase
MFDKVNLIFSGFNQRAVVAFLRTLTVNKQPFAIIAISNSDPILLTDYKTNVFSIRKVVSLDLNDILNSINEANKKISAKEYIIAPSTEALNRFMLEYKSEFNNLNCVIPLAHHKLYKLISDKHSFGELCMQNGINVPETYKSLDSSEIPFVAKPINYFSNKGNVYSPVLIFNDKDKINFIKNYNPEDFYYQKFVTGKSLYLLYYFHRNGNVYKYSQENIIQQPDGKSIVSAVSSTFHLSKESIKYEHLFKAINFHGFVMVEVKQENGINYMIEANPRFWGPSQLFVDANRNFFEVFLQDYASPFNQIQFSINDEMVRYFWYGGILETLRLGKKLIFHKNNENKFTLELAEWLRSDIYKRPDTLEIFKNELK